MLKSKKELSVDAVFADPALLVQIVIALVITGVIAGLLAGLLGVGGGIVIVPVLFFLFQTIGVDGDVAMHVAVGTSLATIIATSISSVRSHHRQGAVDWTLLRRWVPGIVGGVVIGTVLAAHLSGHILTLIFAIFAFLVALRMLFSKTGGYVVDGLPGLALQLFYSLVIGIVSVMVGIGGGAMTVPILNAHNYPMRKAVATASGIGMVIALPGTVGFIVAGWTVQNLPPFSWGYVNMLGFLLIIPLTVLCAPWGAKIAHSVNPTYLKRGFAVFLLVSSVKMLLKVFS